VGAFADNQLFLFAQDAFVAGWLANQIGLLPLFSSVYRPVDFQIQELTLAGVQGKRFELPVLETVRVRGTDEQTAPATTRVKIERERLRAGRLAWVDVFLDVVLTVRVTALTGPIDHVAVRSLLDKLGPVASLADLRTRLEALYAPSVVDAFFGQLRVTSLDDLLSRPALFLQLVYKAPPAPDPGEARNYPVNVCVQVREDVAVREALQGAKLCRGILENQGDFAGDVAGADVLTPYAFVVVFPDALVTDATVPGLTAAQFKAGVRSLFAAENLLAQFA
jgi:hypothetical protein